MTARAYDYLDAEVSDRCCMKDERGLSYVRPAPILCHQLELGMGGLSVQHMMEWGLALALLPIRGRGSIMSDDANVI